MQGKKRYILNWTEDSITAIPFAAFRLRNHLPRLPLPVPASPHPPRSPSFSLSIPLLPALCPTPSPCSPSPSSDEGPFLRLPPSLVSSNTLASCSDSVSFLPPSRVDPPMRMPRIRPRLVFSPPCPLSFPSHFSYLCTARLRTSRSSLTRLHPGSILYAELKYSAQAFRYVALFAFGFDDLSYALHGMSFLTALSVSPTQCASRIMFSSQNPHDHP